MGKTIPNLQQFLLLIFLSLCLFTLDSFNLLQIPKTFAFYLSNPVSFGIYRMNQVVNRQLYFLFAARVAAQENKALKEQIGQLLSENAFLKKSLLETKAEVIQEHSLDPRTYHLIAARPVGLTRFLKIDKGMNSGLKLNQVVVHKDNYIGQIVQISAKESNIRLLTDPESKIAAFSLGKTGRSKGVLVGQFGEILMDQILHEEQIAEDDLVYSEGTEGFLPRGLVLGRVTGIVDNKSLPFKQAKVKPVFDYADLELVFVIGE